MSIIITTVAVCLRAVPHDTKDDVVEKFLSKILPGSGTVYRSDHFRVIVQRTTTTTTSRPAGAAITRQTANRTSTANRSSLVAHAVSQSNDAAAMSSSPLLRKTKRRLCKTVPMASRDSNQVQMNTICYHVSDDGRTAAAAVP